MSALGNYVHLHKKNYKNFGTAKIGQAPIIYNYVNSRTFLNNRLSGIKDIINSQTLDVLSARLKSNTSQTLTKSEQSFYRDQQQQIEYIYDLIYQQVKNIGATKKTLTNMTKGQGVRYNKKNKNTETISTTSQWTSTRSHSELMKLREKKQREYKELNRLIKNFNEKENPKEKDLQKIISLYEQYVIAPDGYSTAGEIEKAIGNSRYQGTAQQVAGAFGEALFAACDDTANNLAKKEFYEFLKTAVVGSHTADIIIPKDLITSGLKTNFLNKTTSDGTSYYLGTTQNKVDVKIKVNNEDLFLSVKDYAVKDGNSQKVHLQEVNLFQTIAFLNSYMNNFGNHWLNMHALRGSWKGKSEADQIVKKEIAYEALAGGSPFKIGVDQANVFGYINRATGEVFVKTVKDILLKEFSRISMTGGDIGKIMLSNRKQKSPEGRITALLNELHSYNLTVSLKI